MSNPNPSADVARAPRWFRWIGIVALAAYAWFLFLNSAIVAGGSDSSGYLNSARLLAEGKLLAELRAPAEFGPRAAIEPMHFLPQGFFPFTDRTKLTPTYPTGLPLHFTFAAKIFGWKFGPWVVVLAAALVSVCLCYVLAREVGVSVPLAAAGAVTLAAFPVFIFTSIQPLSDTLATTWTLAALVAGLRARRNASWSLACGGAFAMAVLVRPTNLLLAPALLVLLGLDGKKIGVFIAGGVPGAAWLAFYNHQLYGSALRSGYGDDVFGAFAVAYGPPTALHFAKWLALLLPTALLALPLVTWVRRDGRTREVLALTLAFAAITVVYAFYEVSHEVWWCLRFILPAAPPLICLGVLGAERIAHSTKARCVTAALIGCWAFGCAAYWAPRLDVFMMKHYEQAYADGAIAAREKLPREALVVSFAFSGALYFYSDFPVLRWDQVEPPVFARYVGLAQTTRRPICAVLFDWEEKDAFRRCPGGWTRLASIRNVSLWQLAP
jgi:4-amino-4-deoxy-L-arabinose transferase-like glycosyltransferase